MVYDGPTGGLDRERLIDIYGPEFEDVFWEGAAEMNRRRLLAIGACLARLAMAACSACAPKPAGGRACRGARLLGPGGRERQHLDGLWKPILADMEKQIGLQVKPFFASNYTGPGRGHALQADRCGLVLQLRGLEAVRRADGEVFARTFDPSGTTATSR